MRIVFVTNNYTPYTGGVVSAIKALTYGLEQVGCEVHIITLDFLGNNHGDPHNVQRVPCPIRFVYKGNRMAIPWRPYSNMLRIIKDLKPTIIHSHHPFLLGSTARAVARALSIPHVFTYHTLYESYMHYVPLPISIGRFFLKRHIGIFLKSVDGIIVPSKAVCDYIKQTYAVKPPMQVLPSPLQLPYTQQEIAFKKLVLHAPFHLLLVTRFVPEKNIKWVLTMYCQLKKQGSFVLTLVGYGFEYESLKQYAYSILKLSDKEVIFIHKPSPEQLIRSYIESYLFVFPSLIDTQGLVLAESMACGMPVIALPGPGQQDIIRNGYNGFIVDTESEMVDTIVHISRNSFLYQALQEGAFHTALAYYPQQIAKQLVSFYTSCIEQKIK